MRRRWRQPMTTRSGRLPKSCTDWPVKWNAVRGVAASDSRTKAPKERREREASARKLEERRERERERRRHENQERQRAARRKTESARAHRETNAALATR